METPLLYQYMKVCSTSLSPVFTLEIRKVLSKLCKEKGCECIAEWIKPCENHLYWSATTTFSGNGQVHHEPYYQQALWSVGFIV